MTAKKTFRFKFYDCHLVVNRFREDNSICLNLVAANTPFNQSNDIYPYEPIARASVCVDHIPCKTNQSLVRDYAESKGLIDVLVKEGFVEIVQKIVIGHAPNGQSLDCVLVNVLVDEDED